jgi:hypothetical protein
MRKRAFPPLEERFEFLGDGMPAGDRSALSSSIFEVEERRTGTPFNLKLWRKTGTAVDDDLRALCSCWTSSFSSRLFCRPQPRSLPACRRMQAHLLLWLTLAWMHFVYAIEMYVINLRRFGNEQKL